MPSAVSQSAPAAGEGEAAVLVEQALTGHRVRDRDTQPPGEMVVARARSRERVGSGDGPERARPLLAGREMRHQILEQLRHSRVGELHVAMAPLPPLGQEAAGDEPVEVLARGRASNSRVPRELARRPGAAVEERKAESSAGVIGEQAREARERGALAIRLHASIVHAVGSAITELFCA